MSTPFGWAGEFGGLGFRRAPGDTRALVSRAKAGERSAFGELFDLHVDRVFEYLAYQLDGEAEVAQQLTEQVFFHALEHLPECPNDVSFSGWLYRLAAYKLRLHLAATAGYWLASSSE